jgi:hypothetical protein
VEIYLFRRGRVATAAAFLRFFMACFAALLVVGFFTEVRRAGAPRDEPAGLAWQVSAHQGLRQREGGQPTPLRPRPPLRPLQLFKLICGRLRPDFLDRCKPKLPFADVSGPGGRPGKRPAVQRRAAGALVGRRGIPPRAPSNRSRRLWL